MFYWLYTCTASDTNINNKQSSKQCRNKGDPVGRRPWCKEELEFERVLISEPLYSVVISERRRQVTCDWTTIMSAPAACLVCLLWPGNDMGASTLEQEASWGAIEMRQNQNQGLYFVCSSAQILPVLPDRAEQWRSLAEGWYFSWSGGLLSTWTWGA